MSMELLQTKIRKTKNPTILDLDMLPSQIPPHILREEGQFLPAWQRCALELLGALRGLIPAVKLSFSAFAVEGTEGLVVLSRLLDQAKSLGYYVILEVPEALTPQRAQANAEVFLDNRWPCDGLLISCYIGSDAIKPYALGLENCEKTLFIAARTANRSAMELQDLLAGGRHVFEAVSDVVNRYQNTQKTKSGYDRVALVGPASSAAILQKLREKYKNLFILVDGYDYPSANAKNCAAAADKLGHGVIVCSGTAISSAWQIEDRDGLEYLEDARQAAERMKKNLGRYFTIL